MSYLHILYKFSRPHTIIGSFFSIVSLFSIVVAANHKDQFFTFFFQTQSLHLLILSILSALLCNLFITGINQWADVETDKINKPWLPIPAGLLTKKQALTICICSIVISLLTAAYAGMFLFFLILLISLIGLSYSLPPLKFKMHHLGAAIAISLVRGLLVNIGFLLFFNEKLNGSLSIPNAAYPLIFFITFFSIGIAWFKDIPDLAGDLKAGVKTLALQLSPDRAFSLGAVVIGFSYLGMISYFCYEASISGIGFHSAALLLFLLGVRKTKPGVKSSMQAFYKAYWILFFAEYLFYPAVVIL